MVVPFAAGGPTDVVGRILADRLSDALGQQVIVENIGGAGGMNGAQRIALATPDGYQVLLGTVGTQAYNQSLYKKPLYNAVDDFAPVVLIAEQAPGLGCEQELSGGFAEKLHRLRQNQCGETLVRFGWQRFGDPFRLRAAQHCDRRKRAICAVSGLGAGIAGIWSPAGSITYATQYPPRCRRSRP
jgi:hypothetical protein